VTPEVLRTWRTSHGADTPHFLRFALYFARLSGYLGTGFLASRRFNPQSQDELRVGILAPGRFSIFVLVVSKGCKPAVSPPFQRNAVNLNHCARFVFLSRAVDETDSPYYAANAVVLLVVPRLVFVFRREPKLHLFPPC